MMKILRSFHHKSGKIRIKSKKHHFTMLLDASLAIYTQIEVLKSSGKMQKARDRNSLSNPV